MDYGREFDFFRRMMNSLRIPVQCFAQDDPPVLGGGLGEISEFELHARALFKTAKHDTLYEVIDVFALCYHFLLLPGTDRVMFMGPYLFRDMSDQEMRLVIEQNNLPASLLSSIKLCYANLPMIADREMFLTLLNTFAEQIWGGANAYEIERYHPSRAFLLQSDSTDTVPESVTEAAGFKMMEERYETEKRLIHLVSQGRMHRAQMIVSQIGDRTLESRTLDPVRNMKNYGVVLNTLLRKAVEEGGVHPIHIDSLSSAMAKRLELSRTPQECRQLFMTMVHKYCLLVKNHSMKSYSLLVQHVILRVETDLTADLSLKAHAEALSVNPSYLSTLFKKETGMTLTDFVNHKRIDNAIFLLNATDMQIQTIAQHCGIPDVNYFTKTFKKLVGKTPKQYRLEAHMQGGV